MISLFRRLSKDKGHAGRDSRGRVSKRASELSLAATAAASTEEVITDCVIGGVGAGGKVKDE